MATTAEAVAGHDFKFFFARIAELNSKAAELLIENERLKRRCSDLPVVYRETEATQEKLRTNAGMIRRLTATVKIQKQTIDEFSARIDYLKRGTAEGLEDEVRALDVRLREHIETYRDKFAVMVDKIEELTPERECCVDGVADCPSWRGKRMQPTERGRANNV